MQLWTGDCQRAKAEMKDAIRATECATHASHLMFSMHRERKRQRWMGRNCSFDGAGAWLTMNRTASAVQPRPAVLSSPRRIMHILASAAPRPHCSLGKDWATWSDHAVLFSLKAPHVSLRNASPFLF